MVRLQGWARPRQKRKRNKGALRAAGICVYAVVFFSNRVPPLFL